MKRVLVFMSIAVSSAWGISVKDADFFRDTINAVGKSVDLAKDYRGDGTDDQDDSPALQRAIDDMTRLRGGGKIVIPAGRWRLSDIALKSNVHLVVSKDAVLVPTRPSGFMFRMGLDRKGANAAKTIRNVSIRGEGGRYIVDLSAGRANEKLAFVNCRNVDNFMIADFRVLDNYTRLPAVTLNVAEYEGQWFLPRNGVVRNADIEHAHVGYGLIQVQLGHHIVFRDLSGQGGVTLRLESGAVSKTPPSMNIDDVYGLNISNRNGSSAFIMGPHVKVHGRVYIDGAVSYGSAFVGGVGRGFARKDEAAAGKKAGHFAAGSVVRNVHAVFGTHATVKSKNRKHVPEALRHLLSDELGPDGNSYRSPSIAVLRYHDPNVIVENVTWEGFEHAPAPVLVDPSKVDNPAVLARLQARAAELAAACAAEGGRS